MDMDFVILSMEKTHIPGLVRLEEKCFVHPWSAQSFREELENPTARFFVAVSGSTVIGYVGANDICGEVYITDIAVDPLYRRNGIADALMACLVKRARDEKASFITLEVRKSNAAAIAFYLKNGYRHMGIRPHFYTDPDEDACIMTKELIYGDTI